jgi:non-canonical purine NTP pyrophosphatase (RdgB/HAM1 family)
MNVVYVTGNAGKAKYFSKIIGLDIEHHDADVDEIQSLDAEEIAVHKAKQAYDQLKRPVIVEDTSLTLKSMGPLPVPFIKWFEVGMGLEGFCRLADFNPDRSATVSNIHVYHDGQQTHLFKSSLDGLIADHPGGEGGFGFNPCFIPIGKNQTLAEMPDEEFIEEYLKFKPILQLKEFLLELDNKK